MANFHISPKTGLPAPCRASKRACPVGGEHYLTREAAELALAQELEGEHGAFKKFEKSTPLPPEAEVYSTLEEWEMQKIVQDSPERRALAKRHAELTLQYILMDPSEQEAMIEEFVKLGREVEAEYARLQEEGLLEELPDDFLAWAADEEEEEEWSESFRERFANFTAQDWKALRLRDEGIQDRRLKAERDAYRRLNREALERSSPFLQTMGEQMLAEHDWSADRPEFAGRGASFLKAMQREGADSREDHRRKLLGGRSRARVRSYDLDPAALGKEALEEVAPYNLSPWPGETQGARIFMEDYLGLPPEEQAAMREKFEELGRRQEQELAAWEAEKQAAGERVLGRRRRDYAAVLDENLRRELYASKDRLDFSLALTSESVAAGFLKGTPPGHSEFSLTARWLETVSRAGEVAEAEAASGEAEAAAREA